MHGISDYESGYRKDYAEVLADCSPAGVLWLSALCVDRIENMDTESRRSIRIGMVVARNWGPRRFYGLQMRNFSMRLESTYTKWTLMASSPEKWAAYAVWHLRDAVTAAEHGMSAIYDSMLIRAKCLPMERSIEDWNSAELKARRWQSHLETHAWLTRQVKRMPHHELLQHQSPLTDWLMYRDQEDWSCPFIDRVKFAKAHRLWWHNPAERYAADWGIVPPRKLVLASRRHA